jgi:hypothetical protein
MNTDWPPLPLTEWEPTYLTLHRWTQVLGKIRMALEPPLNHWWHVTLAVTTRGLEANALPHEGRFLSLALDFDEHRLSIHTSDGRSSHFDLRPMAVAEFYERTMGLLHELGVNVAINPVPVEVSDTTPFHEDYKHNAYDREYVSRLHRILLQVDRVFRAERGAFLGKSSPSHFFWGAFDLAFARYSGRRNPQPPGDPVMGEAYSHEEIAHGFWPGGDWPIGPTRMEEAVFYSYAVPQPDALNTATIAPSSARYDARFGEFILPYEAVRASEDPAETLAQFMRTTYRQAARLANWDPVLDRDRR